jgi:hypothetical protein
MRVLELHNDRLDADARRLWHSAIIKHASPKEIPSDGRMNYLTHPRNARDIYRRRIIRAAHSSCEISASAILLNIYSLKV